VPAPSVESLSPEETRAAQAAAAKAEEKRRDDWTRGLNLFAIFLTTIVGIILRPLPMGSVAMAGITLVALTGTLSTGDAFSGFNNKTIWLIALAFFIARAFVKTGLGSRIAYLSSSSKRRSMRGARSTTKSGRTKRSVRRRRRATTRPRLGASRSQ
jgi:di/tricarboxylate transporter